MFVYVNVFVVDNSLGVTVDEYPCELLKSFTNMSNYLALSTNSYFVNFVSFKSKNI